MTRRTFGGYSSYRDQPDQSRDVFRQYLSEALEEARFPAIVVAGVLGLGLLIATWFEGLSVLATLDLIFRGFAHIWMPLLLISVAVPLGLALGRSEYSVWQRVRGKERLIGRGRIVIIAVVIVALAGAANAFLLQGYLTDRQNLEGSTTVDETTSYAERAPWSVAENYASRDQGDVVGERDGAHFVPAAKDAAAEDGEGTSRYTALVKGRAFLGMTGYSAVQVMDMPTTGSIPGGASTYCEMPETMNKRLTSFWPWHSLAWSIGAKAPLSHFNGDDAYGYCDGDDPVVVVPLFKYEGFWALRKVPAGAAVYTADGLRILSGEELAEEGVEGPTYPRSVAITQRKAYNSGGGWGSWISDRYGYDLTSKDAEDSNAGNTSEFTLIGDDGEMQYVTPLVPKGTSQSITAVSSVPAQQGAEGGNGLTITTSPDLGSTSTITTAIKESSVQGDSSWTTRWSAGMGVYEILPGKDGHWVASIGQGQAVSYRADIAPDGTVVVTNADTGASSDSPAKDDAPEGTASSGKPLSEMTDKELLDTIQQATEELQKRESEGSDG